MSTEYNIIKKLHGVKDKSDRIDEATFQVNDKRYTSGFGNYFCNGNPIAKEEYEKARDVYMFKPDRDAKVRKARKETDEVTKRILDKAMQLGAKKPARDYGTRYGYDKEGELKYCYAKGDILPKTETPQDVARAIDDLFDAAVYNLTTTKKGYNDIYADAIKIMQDAVEVELPTTTALKFDYMKVLDTHHNKHAQVNEGLGVRTEAAILAKLFENKDDEDADEEDLDEAGFTTNGKVYKSAFGRYSCDGKPITRDEYFKARDSYDPSDGPVSITKFASAESLKRFKGDELPKNGWLSGKLYPNASYHDLAEAPAKALKSGNLKGFTYEGTAHEDYHTTYHTFKTSRGDRGVLEVSQSMNDPDYWEWRMHLGLAAKDLLKDIDKIGLKDERSSTNDKEGDIQDLDEAGFTANGKVYKSGFGRYSCDGKPISREEYVQARQEYDAGGSSSSNTEVGAKKAESPKKDEPVTARKDFYDAGNFKELGKGNFNDDMMFLNHKAKDGSTVRIQYGDKSETYARKTSRGWKTDDGRWISANDIASAARDGAKVKVNHMVKSKIETDYDRISKDNAEKSAKIKPADLDQVNRHSAKRAGDFMNKLYHDTMHPTKGSNNS